MGRGCYDFKMVGFILCFFQFFLFYFSWNTGMLRLILDLRKKIFFSCFHWNVNSILAHNRLSFLEPCNTVHQYDILFISETYLDSSVLTDDTLMTHQCLLPFSVCVIRSNYSKTKRLSNCYLLISKSNNIGIWWILIKFWEAS